MEPQFLTALSELGKVGGPWTIAIVLLVKWMLELRKSSPTNDAYRLVSDAIVKHDADTAERQRHLREALTESNLRIERLLGQLDTSVVDLGKAISEQTAVLRELKTMSLMTRS